MLKQTVKRTKKKSFRKSKFIQGNAEDFFRTTGFEERFNSKGGPLIDRALMMRTLYHNAQKFMHDAHFSGHFFYYSPSSNVPVFFNS